MRGSTAELKEIFGRTTGYPVPPIVFDGPDFLPKAPLTPVSANFPPEFVRLAVVLVIAKLGGIHLSIVQSV